MIEGLRTTSGGARVAVPEAVAAFLRVAAPVSAAALLAVVAGTRATAQESKEAPAKPGATVVAVADARYQAGWLHRLFLGGHRREVWATPVHAPVLDLASFAGGLHPVRRGGGGQTNSLRLTGNDGRIYVFRSIVKDAARGLPPELRRTVAAAILQDQMSAMHPGGALVLPPLLAAVGVLHADPRLVVMPDDSTLGEFRREFAGALGFLEERPNEGPDGEPGFAGSTRIVASERLFEHLEESSRERIDARAFLTARLLDILVGDWDRHPDQWRWARFDEGDLHVWRPIPRDRDFAFCRLDGPLIWAARFQWPQLVGFGPGYPSARNQTWNGRTLDRRLLTSLEKPVWDSTAAALKARLSDPVLEAAIRQLPPEYLAQGGAQLLADLETRRDHLPQAADAFYRLLAQYVDVDATDEPELGWIERRDDGAVQVKLYRRRAGANDAAGDPYFQRTFLPGETHEVRLYLHGGDDRLVVRGSANRGVRVRVVGGGGDDVLIDSAGGSGRRTFLYDDRGTNELRGGPGTVVDRRHFEPPPAVQGQSANAPPEDRGTGWLSLPLLSYESGTGVFLGASVTRWGYGFRALPYRTRSELRVGYATTAAGVRLEYVGEVRRSNSATRGVLRLRASNAELERFFGFGNETDAGRPDAAYRVTPSEILVEPALVAEPSPRLTLSVGPRFLWRDAHPAAGTLLAEESPYGIGIFREAGLRAGVHVEGRDDPRAARRGIFLDAAGTVYPALLSVDRAFGSLDGAAGAYLSAHAPGEPTLAARVGGKKLWGEYPFHEAAFLGGAQTVRGFTPRRFAGDASLYGNLELRLALTRFFLVVPGKLGIFGLSDAGRVYVAGDSSSRWHTAAGGGLWASFVDPGSLVSLAVARSAEGTSLSFKAGFAY